MQLLDKSGILCDRCGLICTGEFIYYSIDSRQVEVKDGLRPPLQNILTYKISSSFDYCTKCFEEIQKAVVETFKKTSGFRGVVCDISSIKLTGSFLYYYNTVTKVNVKLINKTAKVSTIDRILDFTVCEQIYNDMLHKLEQAKLKNSGWSTST